MKTTTPSDADHPHYAWGASGAKTWRACPGSINFANAKKAEGSIPADTSTAYSIEGTKAHDLADRCLKGEITREQIPSEFMEHLEGYLDFANELAIDNGGDVWFEQQVPLFYNTQASGTVDYCVVSADRVDLLDLKYGAGVAVSAEENDQLIIYAISIIEWMESQGVEFTEKAEILLHIYQPRHRDFDGMPDTWVTTVRDILDYRKDILENYVDSKNADPDDRRPSPDACQFCDARRVCDKRVLQMFEDIPDELNPVAGEVDTEGFPAVKAEINDTTRLAIFKYGKAIAKFFEDVNEDTMTLIEHGHAIDGLKTVDGGPGNRSWGDNEAEAEKLLRKLPAELRYKPRQVVSPAQAEKVLKKNGTPIEKMSTRFVNRFNELIFRKEGSPKLALASDKKPSRIPVAKQFDEEPDDTVDLDDCF